MSISAIGFRGAQPIQFGASKRVQFAGATQIVTDADFQREVLDASHHKPVLVDFFAEWCPPCQRLGPDIDALSTDLAANSASNAKVVKYNVDPQNRHKIMLKGAARQNNIQNIPTLIVFKNGQPVERIVGQIPRAELDALIARHRN